jgi:UDP-N-acetylmuramate dehydrogenase
LIDLVTTAMKQTSDRHGLIAEMRLIEGLELKTGEPLARYTSMKVGGPADFLLEVRTEQALARLLPLLGAHRMPFLVLGNGSNVLFSDRGVRGAVIHLSGAFRTVEWREGEAEERVIVEAGAACAIMQLVREAARRGYAGIEFAEGIPGSVGGAVVMNAGAYGREFESVIDQVFGVTPAGAALHLSRSEIPFSYRDAHLPAGMVVTRAALRLEKDAAAGTHSNINDLVARRKSSQPSGHPNSGSMFRNPPDDFAGRLIEAAGLKGRRLGQAQISDRHANFIVNLGGARAGDVRRLMEVAREEVERRFGVTLFPEVKLFGEWREGD